jgi:hypothetical protein
MVMKSQNNNLERKSAFINVIIIFSFLIPTIALASKPSPYLPAISGVILTAMILLVWGIVLVVTIKIKPYYYKGVIRIILFSIFLAPTKISPEAWEPNIIGFILFPKELNYIHMLLSSLILSTILYLIWISIIHSKK